MAKKVTSKKSNVVNNRPNCLKITKRTQKVNLQTVTTKDGKNKCEDLGGFIAQVFQHECDHLNGILI